MGVSGSHGDVVPTTDAATTTCVNKAHTTFLFEGADNVKDLQRKLASAIASRRLVSLRDGTDTPGAGKSSGRRTFYDNGASALTLRGWWLCEQDGGWLLRVPLLTVGQNQMDQAPVQTITAPDEILEISGLNQHAEVFRSGKCKDVERLLRQAGVVPFASIRVYQTIYEFTESENPMCQLVVEHLVFDATHADDAVVSDLLFEHGEQARSHLRAAVVHVRWKGDSEVPAKTKFPQDLCAALGRSVPVHPRAAFPEAVAYLRSLRAEHLRKLRKTGVPLADDPE